MEIGLVGLGKMGFNLALNLRDHGYQVVGFDRDQLKAQELEQAGLKGVTSLTNLVTTLKSRRVIWLMVPAGDLVDEVIAGLLPMLTAQDILIDGGNSNYKDTLRRYKYLKEKQIDFVDVGTSGGISGARTGACTMIGADDEVFSFIEPLFQALSVENGYLHTGRCGSGHYVKMVHNGVEYGMMQAIGEGFEILDKGPFDLDLPQVARVWNHGSVIRSWLMELTVQALVKDPNLSKIKGIIHSSGEGLWTIQEALELGVPVPVIAESLFARYRSQQDDTFSGKVVAALRNEFGGHAVETK